MLFTESDLMTTPDPFQILDRAVYLTERETCPIPGMVTVCENTRLGLYTIDFNGVRTLSETTGMDYLDAIVSVAEADEISLDQVCIAIDEADLIEDPELVSLGPIVVVPISENSSEYLLTEFLLESVMEESEDWDENRLTELLLEMTWEDLMKHLNGFKDKYGLNDPQTKKLWKKMARFAHPDMHRDDPEAPDSAVDAVRDAIRKMGGKASANFYSSPKGGSSPPPNPPPPKGSKTGGSGNGGSSGSKTGGSSGGGIFGGLGGGSKTGGSGNGGSSGSKTGGSSGGGIFGGLGGGSKTGGSGNGGSSGSKTGGSSGGGIFGGLGGGSKTGGSGNGGSFGVAAGIGAGLLAYRHYQNKPKSIIAKRIASLRSIYQKFLHNAQSNPAKAGVFKRMAAKVLGVIDKLMAFMQRKADGR